MHKLNQVHSQQEQLKVILREHLKGLLHGTIYLIYEFRQRNTGILGNKIYDVVAMVKQLGIPTYFLRLSCADLRWEKLPYIINKLNNLGLSHEELKSLSYQERCNFLNNNPVLVARHLQHKFEVFFQRNCT